MYIRLSLRKSKAEGSQSLRRLGARAGGCRYLTVLALSPDQRNCNDEAVPKLGVKSIGGRTMIYGYARVSTAMQGRDGNSIEEQVNALRQYGCNEIVTEAYSGKTMDRPQFNSLLDELASGDTLVVCKLDRFARTAVEGVQTVQELFERGIKVHILNMGLIEDTSIGRLILTVLLAFAEYERSMIVERCAAGKSIARQDPNYKEGRPKKFSPIQITHALELLEDGHTYKQVEALTGISKSTLIRARRK